MNYRQGDIVLRQVEALPKKGAKRMDGVLEMGGETGNPHKLEGEHELYASGRRLLLVVKSKAELVHPDHEPLKVQQGVYQVQRIREFNRKRALTSRVSTRRVWD